MTNIENLSQDELIKMFGIDMQELGDYVLANLKTSSFFPVDTKYLRDSGTRGSLKTTSVYNIVIGAGKSKKYVESLNEGAVPHDIPNAFGLGYVKRNPYTNDFPFGVGGKFNGKFHPGQSKHKGFVDKLFTLACEKCKTYLVDDLGFTITRTK